MWRQPKSLLGKDRSTSNMIPLCADVIQGHLLCASEEFPLCGRYPVTVLAGEMRLDERNVASDFNLFGASTYEEAISALMSTQAILSEEKASPLADLVRSMVVYKPRPSLRRAWSRVTIRSIEPIQYSIVDLSHAVQRGRTDEIHSPAAVLDTIPYSRVFYYTHPGAIITHRARKLEIVSMTLPPAFAVENYSCIRNRTLAAFVKPSSATHFTRPLSKTLITIVKKLETVELREQIAATSKDTKESHRERVSVFAGCGVVNVKRQVRGYRKLSSVNFREISKHELSMPPIEYDTFGLFMCTDSETLSARLGERFGSGVHALSHAVLAVAPLFAEGLTRSDLECDHSHYAPTQLKFFDERAGGSGCTQRLWKCFFQSNSILEAAVQLMKNCSSCGLDSRYDSGCPACLHASNCLEFNKHLSRSSAIVIGERMLERVKATDLYKKRLDSADSSSAKDGTAIDTTPRRKARLEALKRAKEMHPARQRQFVVGRPSWPLDDQGRRHACG
jgi:DEAD/DEAH box helicase domain-containing protein